MAAINKRKLLESAQKNLQKGAVDKALKDYQALLDADPRDANVRLKVGDLKLRLGKSDEAIAAYLKVADQFTRDGFDAKAVAIYKQVSKLDTKRFDVYIPLADLYQRLGLTSEAMVALQTAAEAYQRDGRKREALDLLRRMASLDAANTTSRLKVAELLLQEGLSSEALLEFNEVVAELERQGDWEARAGVLQRVIELTPERPESYEALITLWLERRQPKRAEGFVRKLIAIDAERAESHELLARVLSELGDENGAIEAFRSAADAWIARGMEDRARAILQRHIPSEPFDFGGTTDPLELGTAGSASREAESPFGEEGIGAEPPRLDDEFAFVDDSAPIAPVPEPPVAKATTPAAGQPEPKPLPTPKPLVQPSQPAPEAKPIAKADAATLVRELTTPVAVAPPPPVAPASAVPTEVSDVPADLDQLLAEAGVYLRYGKRERAIASLETLLGSEPHHAAALELLGDAHAGAEDTALAVDAWTRAAQSAAALGDATRVAALRSRIEAIDSAAAAALPAAVEAPRSAAAATMLFEVPAPDEASPDADIEADSSESLDDIEIDIDAEEFGEASEEFASSEVAIVDADVAALAAPETDAPSAESSDVEIGFDADTFVDLPGEDESEGDGDSMSAASSDFESTHFEAVERPDETSPFAEPEVPDSFEVAETVTEAVAAPLSEPTPIVLQPPSDSASESESEPEPEALPEFEIELSLELELEPAVDSPPEPALQPESASQPEPAPEEPLAPEFEVRPAITPEPQPEERPAPASMAASASGEFSTTTSAEITEDLEEASFYFEQGLFDEAEAIYLRVVQRAPNHPSALLRLGEIAVARGQDAARAVADVSQSADEVPVASDAAFETAQEVEPPDDLDLTAREFGPSKMWADDSRDDDVALPAPDVAIADDETDGGFEIETGSIEATIATPELVAAHEPVVESIETTPAPPEPTPISVTEVQAESLPEPELTVPEVSLAEDAGAPAFDLAAELSESLADGAPAARAGASTDADGFSSLFSEFKRGVSRTLGEGDVETHFDLGIAYREMGLLDDAIGEFHYALGSSGRRLDALHMMGLCALDVGRAADAIGHLEQALASPEVPAERETALRFDLGRAHEAEGDRNRALDAFRRVAELDADFQDVGAHIEALLCGPAASDAEVADESDDGEVYESFDDLIAEAADEAPAVVEPEPIVAESYENFDEFLSEDGEDDAADAADGSDVGAEGDTDASCEVEADETVAAAIEVIEATEVPEPADSEPEPTAGAPRRRKVSFF